MGYALPSNEAQIILEQLLIDGTTPRPHMGIIPRHVDENQRDLFSLPAVGVLVVGIAPDSAAEEAGLEEGDLIVGFNELVIETIPDLAEALADSEVGQTVNITLYRRGIQLMEIDVTLGDANAG
jgi:serine protease Do